MKNELLFSKIKDNWKSILKEEFNKEYFLNILISLEKETKSNHTIFPETENIFRALKLIDYDKIKVVVIGQDPYHGVGQANGFAFAVNPGVKKPPSLKNIFKEIASDLNTAEPTDPSLLGWAMQGVLMINAVLTVRKDDPASHKHFGWQTFTDKLISLLNDRQEPIVFILWGGYAKQKEELITNKRHFILKSPHPSPFSVHSGFFGCKHFSKTNQILESLKLDPIDWTKTGN